jgi:hypothetical protein
VDNLLLQAWHYRSKHHGRTQAAGSDQRQLKPAIPLAILNGLVLWCYQPRIDIYSPGAMAGFTGSAHYGGLRRFPGADGAQEFRRNLAVGIGLAFIVAIAILFAYWWQSYYLRIT